MLCRWFSIFLYVRRHRSTRFISISFGFSASCFLRRRRKFMLWTLRIGTHITHTYDWCPCPVADACAGEEDVRCAWEHSQARIVAAPPNDYITMCAHTLNAICRRGRRQWIGVSASQRTCELFSPSSWNCLLCVRFRCSCDSNRLTLFFSSPLAARSMHDDATHTIPHSVFLFYFRFSFFFFSFVVLHWEIEDGRRCHHRHPIAAMLHDATATM